MQQYLLLSLYSPFLNCQNPCTRHEMCYTNKLALPKPNRGVFLCLEMGGIGPEDENMRQERLDQTPSFLRLCVFLLRYAVNKLELQIAGTVKKYETNMFIVWNSVTSLNIVMRNMTVVFKLSFQDKKKKKIISVWCCLRAMSGCALLTQSKLSYCQSHLTNSFIDNGVRAFHVLDTDAFIE